MHENYYRNPSNRHCVNDALTQLLGYDPGLPPDIAVQDIARIARRLGLEASEPGDAVDFEDYEGRPVVLIYMVERHAFGPGVHRWHAEYTTQLYKLWRYSGYPVYAGVITKPERTAQAKRVERPQAQHTTGATAMDWLYDLMDLPENLQRALGIIRPLHGLAAAVMGFVLFFLAWLMWPWLWYFDVESTAEWTERALLAISGTLNNTGLPGFQAYATNAAWFVTGATFLPTLIELFTVRFAQGGIKAAAALVIFFSTFDLVTDWPRVSQFVDGLGVDNGLIALALKLPLLILASFGLQSLFIIFIVCGFALLLQFRRERAAGRRPAAMAAE